MSEFEKEIQRKYITKLKKDCRKKCKSPKRQPSKSKKRRSSESNSNKWNKPKCPKKLRCTSRSRSRSKSKSKSKSNSQNCEKKCQPAVNNYLFCGRGATGPVGPTGPAGADGADGPTGPTGDAALSYVSALYADPENEGNIAITLTNVDNSYIAPIPFPVNQEDLGNDYKTSPTPNPDYSMALINGTSQFPSENGYVLVINRPGDYEFHYSFSTLPLDISEGFGFTGTTGGVALLGGPYDILTQIGGSQTYAAFATVSIDNVQVGLSKTVTGFGRLTAPEGVTNVIPYYVIPVIVSPVNIGVNINSLRISLLRLNDPSPPDQPYET